MSVHPSLEVIGGALDSFLPGFTTLDRPYDAYPVICSNTHVETIFANKLRSIPYVRFRRECLRMKDNGVVSLDWVSGDDPCLSKKSPILILLAGLTGGSGEAYIKHMLLRARNKGWRVVAFNSRGCGNSPVITPKFYSASFTGDIGEVVAELSSRYPDANLYAADEGFHKGFNKVYDKTLGASLSKIFRRHASLFEGIEGEYNIPAALNSKSVREFDDAFTRVSGGFKSVDDYYLKSSSSDSIKHVCTPLLCIQAANDPIAPNRGIPRQDIEDNPNCMLIVTPKGGHLAWVAGDEAPFGASWTDPVNYMSFSVSGGFKSVDDYYLKSSSSDSIKHAANDPIAPNRGIPRQDIEDNPNCMLIVTPKGGHLAWVAGDEAPFGASWTDPVVMDFLEHLEKTKSNSF
nr:embryogenesis-associated protein EMB8-like [Tanacetum cinerariifolium]